MIEIRDAEEGEFDKVGELLVDVYSALSDFPSAEEQPDYYQKLGNAKAWTELSGVHVIVAVENNEILGAVIFFEDVKHYGSGGSITSLTNASGFRLLGVSPKARGKGIGKKITLECLRRARESGTERLLIHSTQAMETAWQMYTRMGFKRFPEIDFNQQGLAVFGFQLFLNNHQFPDISKNITDDLNSKGQELNSITVDDLMPYDECHSRGRNATKELTQLVKIDPNTRTLDIGCGIGGTSRFLASQYGCQVTGIDIEPRFTDSAIKLNQLLGLHHFIDVHTMDATDIGDLNQRFDLVLSQHSSMNISDKQTLLDLINECLDARGHYVFHEVFAANDSPQLLFPLPWASEASHSHLVPIQTFKSMAANSGLRLLDCFDRTQETLQHFSQNKERWSDAQKKHPAEFFLGPPVKEKAFHAFEALESNQIEVWMGIMEKGN